MTAVRGETRHKKDRHFSDHNSHRPSITNDMVHCEQQNVVIGAQLKNACPNQGGAERSKGTSAVLGGQVRSLCFSAPSRGFPSSLQIQPELLTAEI